MRTCGQTGSPDISDDLLLGNIYPYFDSLFESGQMHIGRRINTIVSDFDVISTSIGLITFCNNPAFPDGIHRSTRRRSIIYTVMSPVTLQHRVETAVRETGRNPEKIQRSFQKGPLQTLSCSVVI